MPDISSLYPAPPVPAGNALTSDPARVIGLLGPLNQAALFQQTFAGRKAIGEAYQHAIRPDGSIDTQALMREIKARPDAGFLAGEASAGALQRQQQQIANTQAQTNLKAGWDQTLNDRLGTLANLDKPTMEDVRNLAVQSAAQSNIPSAFINAKLHSLPKEGPALKEMLTKFSVMARGNAAAAAAENVTTPGGTVQQMTAGQSAQARQLGGPMPGIPGPPLGAEESTKQMMADQAQQGNFTNEIYPLTQALEKARALGPGGMAPGSKGRQEFESYVYGLVPQLVPKETQGKIKNYAELEKYLTQAMQNRAQNLGPHTNEGLATAVTGSPNVHINDLAGVDLIKAAIALRRMEYAQVHQASKAGPVGYTGVKAGFAGNQDINAYGLDLKSPDEIRKLEGSLKGDARTKFNASLRSAIDAGLISKDRLAEILSGK